MAELGRAERRRVLCLAHGGVEFPRDGLLLFVETKQHLDALLRRVESRLGMFRETHSAFEQVKRLLQRQVPPFELLHNLTQLADRRFEIE